MKKSELKCPNCNSPLVDLKSTLKCKSCDKHFMVKISRRGINQFLFMFLPSLTFVVSLYVLDWKIAGFLDIPNREVILYGFMAVGFSITTLAIIKMKSQFEVGDEQKSNAKT